MNFREAFLSCFGVQEPLIELNRSPHWSQSGLSELYPDIGRAKTYVSGGFFYDFYSPLPSLKNLLADEEKAKSLRADYIIVPCVRNPEDSSIFKEHSYFPIKANAECVTLIEGTLEKTFILATTRRYLKNNLRYKRISDLHYSLESFLNEEITDDLLNVVDYMHACLSKKYRVQHIYTEEVLRKMISSRGSTNVRIFIRKSLDTKEPVQTMLLLEYPEARSIHYQTQAIQNEKIPRNHNLYRTGFLEVYEYAIKNGYKSVNLGRGFQEFKRTELASKEIYEQSHWIKKL